MERFDPADVERIYSYLRVGADTKTACSAAGWDKEKADIFAAVAALEIEQCKAQFKVLCLNSIMTEGGASGAKFLLTQSGAAFDTLESDTKKPAGAEPSSADGWDSL